MIPNGYRELQNGEVVEKADLYASPDYTAIGQWRNVHPDYELLVGRGYKTADANLVINRNAKIIRKATNNITATKPKQEQKTKTNKLAFFCKDVSSLECMKIRSLVLKMPEYHNFHGFREVINENYDRNFFLLWNVYGVAGNNHMGFTNADKDDFGVLIDAKVISSAEMLQIITSFGEIDPQSESFIIIKTIDIQEIPLTATQ